MPINEATAEEIKTKCEEVEAFAKERGVNCVIYFDYTDEAKERRWVRSVWHSAEHSDAFEIIKNVIRDICSGEKDIVNVLYAIYNWLPIHVAREAFTALTPTDDAPKTEFKGLKKAVSE